MYIVKRLNTRINIGNIEKTNKNKENKRKKEKVCKLNVKIQDLLALFIEKYVI